MTFEDFGKTTTLAERQRAYENASLQVLDYKTPVMIRVDGRSFSKFTKNLKKISNSPWNIDFVESMIEAARETAKDLQGCRLAYVQSDEITFLIWNGDNPRSQPPFGNKTRKLNSLVASAVSVAFFANLTKKIPDMIDSRPAFDSRAWNLPKHEVKNALLFRQQDAIRNSVQMYGRHFFSHTKMNGLNVRDVKKLLKESGTPWEDVDARLRHGVIIVPEKYETDITFVRDKKEQTARATRRRWADYAAPDFLTSGLIGDIFLPKQ